MNVSVMMVALTMAAQVGEPMPAQVPGPQAPQYPYAAPAQRPAPYAVPQQGTQQGPYYAPQAGPKYGPQAAPEPVHYGPQSAGETYGTNPGRCNACEADGPGPCHDGMCHAGQGGPCMDGCDPCHGCPEPCHCRRGNGCRIGCPCHQRRHRDYSCPDPYHCVSCCPGRCLLHSTCNMPPHYPYMPCNYGYYYFRPYNWTNIAKHQNIAASWGLDPVNPYSRAMFESLYAGRPRAQIIAPKVVLDDRLPILETLLDPVF
jgi:hypothetical protein